jgi:hypothetical protein
VARNANTKGCTVAAETPETTIPSFKPGTRITMNLLDPETNRAENLKITVDSVIRGSHGWEYQVQWVRPPALTH